MTLEHIPQQTFIRSRSTIETPEKGMKYEKRH